MLSRRRLGKVSLGVAVSAMAGCVTGQEESVAGEEDVELNIALTSGEELRNQRDKSLACLTCSTERAGPEESDIAYGEDYVVKLPPLDAELERQFRERANYWQLPDRPKVEWLPNDVQPDYRHLQTFTMPEDQGFELNATILNFLAVRNSFVFNNKRPVRVFGLRGCELEGGAFSSGWKRHHRMRLVAPDHIKRSCVLGVWRPDTDEIALFSATTVPQAANMYAGLAKAGTNCSMLPTGLYRYRLATHNAGTVRPQRGALKSDEKYVVLRTARDLVYDVNGDQDFWTHGSSHNIHAATHGWKNPQFDSSGCQTIRGWYEPGMKRAISEWREFQEAAGTLAPDGGFVSASDEEAYGEGTFQYMLLTGLEAALAYHTKPDFMTGYSALRPGSSGDEVLRLRERLAAHYPILLNRGAPAPTSQFDWWTSFAVLSSHKENNGEYLSTIWTAA